MICKRMNGESRYPHNLLLVRAEAADGELGDLPQEKVPDGAAAVSQHLHRGLPQQPGTNVIQRFFLRR